MEKKGGKIMTEASQKNTLSSTKGQDVSDTDLWQQAINGDKRAFEILYFRHYNDLYKYAIKMSGNPELTEDSIHDLFLRIWKRRDEMGIVTGVKTYLWKSLRNSIISKLRKKNRRLRILNSSKDDVKPPVALSVEELIIEHEINRQTKKELSDALNRLTPKHREVIYLKFYHGMTYDEIEEIMSISYQTARNYIYKALKFLKTVLQ